MSQENNPPTERAGRPFSKPALAGFALALIGAGAGVTAPLGSRFGFWDYSFASQILEWTAYTGVIAMLLCLTALVRSRRSNGRRGVLLSLVGLAILVPVIGMPVYWGYAKMKLPPIQDITTDTDNPPEFWFAPNARVYGGAETAAMQRQAYPDIEPLVLPLDAEETFNLALEIVRDKGWKLWVANREEGRIEATAVTFWFGFSDDVSIRITPLEAGSRVDIRSASRFGSGGDGGANANRVRAYLGALKRRAEEAGR